jgi:DNA-directed RNA polymerase, mitochondrial
MLNIAFGAAGAVSRLHQNDAAPATQHWILYKNLISVERKRREDSSEGLEEAQVLEGFVKRKVVKQTVMTTVYGVTKYGATKQIARQLKDIE